MSKAKSAGAAGKGKGKAKVGAATPAPAPAEKDVAALDAEVDSATKAPPGVKTAPATPEKPAPAPKPKVDKESGEKVITATGKFEAVGNEIYNERGVLVGTEESASVAARKADRANSLRR